MSNTSVSGAVGGMTNDAPTGFPSFASLRAVHGELVQSRRDCGDTPEFLDEIAAFIQRGRATGVLLDSSQDRRASQSLLDYWANALYRAGREPPDATLAEFDPALAPELDDKLCPYRGLDAFHQVHHEVFFGRQRLVDEMVDQLKEGRLLTVVGPSGSGKSSAVLAGLLPALRVGAIPGSQSWRYAPPMVPGSNPLANLARLLGAGHAGTAGLIERQVKCFRKDLGHLAQGIGKSSDSPVVLVIDQFEEVFTLCNDDHVRRAFIGNLLGLLQTADVRHTVIITMRVDFEPRVARLPAFHTLFEEAQVRVTPLSAGELREAIEGPAELVGLRFEEGVVDALIQDILGEPAALPLLQFTLLKLWENRERNRVTWEAYQRLGGGRQTLARSADEFYRKLIPEEQVTAKRILLRMVRPSEGLEVTSNRVRRETLYQAGEARDRINRVLDKLIQARLVHLTEGDQPSDAQVEVAHEALVRNWPRLVDWVEDEREIVRRRLRLTAAAEQWEALGRDSEALWRGSLLEEALHFHDLNEQEDDFVQASRALVQAEREREVARQRELARAQALAEAEQRRTRERSRSAKILRRLAEEQARAAAGQAGAARRLRWLLRALGVMFFLAMGAAVMARNFARQSEKSTKIVETRAAEAVAAQETAEAERERAEQQLRLSTSRKLAAIAINNLDIDPERSVLLALEAVSATYSANGTVTHEAKDALHRAVQASRVQLTLAGHSSSVYGVAFSPDGTRLATASGDQTVKIWDTASGTESLTLHGHTNSIMDVTFSPDGLRLATASFDNKAKVWDATSGEELLTLSGHTGALRSVAFSPDGMCLATASDDGSSKMWDAISGQELLTLSGHEGGVSDLVFSPDGKRLATVGDDRKARVWDVATGQELQTLSGHTSEVYGVAFSPDGARLATVSRDNTAKIWDTTSGQELLTLTGHTTTIFEISFSGERLATASADRTVKVWDASSGQELLALAGHTGTVWNATFSLDGTLLATASQDRTARVWNVSASRELLTLTGHEEGVRAVAFSPEGTRLATTSYDWTAKVWDTASGQELLSLSTPARTGSVAFSPDGTRLATAGLMARIWDAASSNELLTFMGHEEGVNAVAFSPDGTRLATASDDRTVKVWDTVSGQELLSLSGHSGIVENVAFSPDGTRLATASRDNTAKVWDAASGQELLTLGGHDDWIFGIAYSPDGKLLATAGHDGTAKIWDTASGKELLTLAGHTGTVFDIDFNPDGTRLATASFDRLVKVWDVASGEELLTLYDQTEKVFGVAFSPDGTHLATAGEDGTVRIHTLRIEELTTLGCDRVTRNLTQDEWETCLGLDLPYRQTCPDLPVHPSAVSGAIAQGLEHARQGKVKEALAAMHQALEWDPSLELNPEGEVVEVLLQQAWEYTYEGKYDDALVALSQAVELDQQAGSSQVQVLSNAYYEVCRRGRSEDLPEAVLAACERAVELAVGTDSAHLNIEICQDGHLDGLGEVVLPACERAVELAIETNDAYLNYRVCQNGQIDGLFQAVLPACERVVYLAVGTDDAYLTYMMCLNKDFDGLAGVVGPACKHAEETAPRMSFGETVTGIIEAGHRYVWIFEGTAKQIITIVMNKDDSDIDPYLTLLGPDGTVLIENDDGGDDGNSRVSDFILPETGRYAIVARTYSDYESGEYALTLTGTGP